MKALERRQKIRHIVYSIPSLIFLVIITFFLVKGAVRVMDNKRISQEHLKNMEKSVAALITREQNLEKGIARLKTEGGIEDEIKERFNVTQEGEFVAVIVDERRVSSSTDDLVLPWYRKFWNVIISVYE